MALFISDREHCRCCEGTELQLSGSIAQPNKAYAIRASSAQPLNSLPLDLNTYSQVEANISLTANRPEETTNKNLVIHKAPLETNINQEQ